MDNELNETILFTPTNSTSSSAGPKINEHNLLSELSDEQLLLRLPNLANCIPITEAIKAQGIDDLTSYGPIQLAIGVAYAVLFLFGLFSNGSVLLAFARNKRLRSPRNFFLLNLILTDVLLCFTALPITPWYAMAKDWTFGPAMCRFVPLCNSCAVFVTSWSLTAIAFDKHMHIVVDPTRRHFSRRLTAIVTFSIWLMSFLVNIPYLMSFELVDGFYIVSGETITPFCGKFCDEFHWASESQRRFYGVIVLLFQFVIPMGVITFCHLRILRKVQKDMIVQNEQFRKTLTNSQRMDAISRKKRVNYTLLGMVLAFIGSNMPLIAVNLAKDFGQEPEFLLRQPYLWPLMAHLAAMSIVCWNPLLFFWLSAKDKSRGGSGRAGVSAGGASEVLNTNPNNLVVFVDFVRRLSRGELPSFPSAPAMATTPNKCQAGPVPWTMNNGGGERQNSVRRPKHCVDMELEQRRKLLKREKHISSNSRTMDNNNSTGSLPFPANPNNNQNNSLRPEVGPEKCDRNNNIQLQFPNKRHIAVTKTPSIYSNAF